MKFVVSAHGTNIANYFLRYHTMQSKGSGGDVGTDCKSSQAEKNSALGQCAQKVRANLFNRLQILLIGFIIADYFECLLQGIVNINHHFKVIIHFPDIARNKGFYLHTDLMF
jgi:hypothetical protein